MQGTQQSNSHANLKCETVWFKTKLVSQFLSLSFLLTQPFYLSYLHAAPVGGNIVGGTGSISQSNLTTTINQKSQNLAIDWQNFDVKIDERVQFIQPNTLSIALNRIIGNNGSVIQGKIDANGQVFLVNPNGILFTSSATVNVAGLVASSLDISPSDFMNGNYIFNEVLGTNGAVINSGVINAATGGLSSSEATGGNVALIGKQVKNTGLISARLGSTALAAGKKAILRFDGQGLIGVRVTEAVLQDDIGVEEAVINSGEIKAAGGRVLLTASVSRDIFSQVVNNAGIRQATSVVVNDDGSFTLGRGADVLNSGSINVSSETNTNNARVVLLGENITNSGMIKADVQNGTAGEIELHANNKTLLIENSITSAQALSTGKGGLIKLLGDRVGLFDEALVNASGVNGGGEVLIGGDRQGLNASIRNAEFIYLGENTTVKADATEAGNGGKIITFAKDTARIHGDLFARGGLLNGDGGFIETSGLIGFNISNAPDVSAVMGNGGLWLIDPNNIRIVNDGVATSININTSNSPFRTTNDGAIIEIGFIKTALDNGNVEIETRSNGTDAEQGSISFEANLDINNATGSSNNRLRLLADRDINFTNGSSITSSNINTNDSVDIELNADINNDGFGNINFDGTTINTYGGDFTILNARNITSTTNASSILTQDGNFTVEQGWNFNNSTVSFDSSLVTIDVGTGEIDLDGVNGGVILGNVTETGGGSNDFNITNASSISQATGTQINVLDRARFGNTANTTSITLIENNNFNSIGLRGASATINDINAIDLADGTRLSTLLDITAGGDITDSGAITVSNVNNDAVTLFDISGSVVIDGNNDNFNNVNFKNASSVSLIDSQGGIAFAANDGVNQGGGVTGNMTIDALNGGDITSFGEINAGSSGLNRADFTVDIGQSIRLDNPNNRFNGRVFFVADSGKINNITIVDTTALALASIDITGNLAVTADSIIFDDTTVGGTLNATTTNASGDITRASGNLDINGFTTLNATGNITLTDSNNDFNDVTILNGGNVSLRDTDAVRLLGSATTGNLTLRAENDISLVGNISTNNNAATNAGNVDFTGNVLLAPTTDGGTININTNATGAFTDGKVTFRNDIDNDQITTTPRNNLNIVTRNGDVDFIGNVGDTRNVGSLVINSGIINSTAVVDLNLVTTRTNVADATNAVDITAGTINLNDNISTDFGTAYARGVRLNGNVVLGADIMIDSGNNNSDGAVTITGTVNGAQSLTVLSESGSVDFQSALGNTTALNSLDINSGSQLGTVNLNAVTTNGGNNVIRVDGSTITLNGNISSNNGGAGGDIRFDGDLVLNSSVSINSAGTGGNGQVDVNGNINGNNATNANTLTISAGDNAVNLNNVGNTQAIQQLVINNTSGNISVGAINTRDNSTTLNDSGVILTSSGTVNLGGNVTTNVIGVNGSEAGLVDINGAAELTSNVTISTNAGTSAGSVDFSNTVDADSAGNERVLTVNAGTATVKFNNVIGGNQALNSLVVNNAGTTSLQQVNTRRGGINVTSATINLAGNLNTKTEATAGQIRLVGAVNLNANTVFDTNGSGSDAAIFINGSVNNATSRTLELNAGTADVTLTGTAGGGTALSNLTVMGNAVSLGNVTTVNAIDVTGNTNGDGIINLSGNLTTTAAGSASDIDLKQANVVLANDVTLQVAGTSNGITVEGTINADLDTNNRTLSFTAGSGLVDLQGDIGTAANGAVQSVSITGTGTTNLQNVTTRSGGLTVSTRTLNLTDNITTADGVVSLTASNQINTGANLLTVNAGLGDVSANRTINATNGLAISSSGQTTLNGVSVSASNATLTVNASNGLSLQGAYNTDDTAMSFNADSDANGAGLLSVASNTSFTFTTAKQQLNFTGAAYSSGTGVIMDAGTNTVQFNGTADVSLGTAGAFSLNNAQLSNIIAGTLEFNAANDLSFTNLSQTSGPAYILNAGNDISNSGAQTSLFSSLTATAANDFNAAANITTNNNLSLTATNINVANTTTLNSLNGDVILNGVIQGASGQLSLVANNGTAQFISGSSVNGLGSLTISANTIDLGSGTNVTTFNNISLASGTTYNQTSNLNSTLGNISITATNGNIGLASNTTNSGSITVSANNGRIFDNNGSAINITSSGKVALTAVGGIGSGDPLELAMDDPNAWLSAANSGSGNIEFINAGEIRLENITNSATGGAFSLTNSGGNVSINKLVIDKAGIANPAVATFNITTGDVLGVYETTNRSAPHVTANSAIFFMNNTGTIGALGAPLITDIPNRLEIVGENRSPFIQFFGGIPPADFIGNNAYRNRALQSIESLSGQQLIQVESLAEIDPAIFTDVRNYAHSDIALMMPSDQRYTTDEEEQEEKQKRKDFLNSTP